MKFARSICLIIFVFAVLSCDKQTEVSKTQETSGLLAEVNGRKIYQQDLDNVLTDMFGEYQASTMDQQARDKALQSLVASHAMADVSVKQMPANELQKIEAKTQRYRDNLLINDYVKNNMQPEPISNQMIEAYYNEHLVHFGQKTVREYELLSTDTVLPMAVRDRFLQAFESLKNLPPVKIQQQLKKQGFDVSYHKGITGENLIAPKINDFIQAQPLKALSNITFVDGKVYVVLVNAELTLAAKPLSTVREEIRKSLAMMQLKKSIKGLSAAAVEQANVVYHTVE